MTRPDSVTSLPAFDPRDVPVVSVDAHLPAVPLARLGVAALRERFATPPEWQAEVLAEKRFTNRALAHASVLVTLIAPPAGAGDLGPSVLLTQRTQHMSTHSGQIAFPGGKADDADADAVATALREAQEEVGLVSACVEVLGTLPTYLTGTQFVVTPVVGVLHTPQPWVLNALEVDAAFEVPLAFLMNPANHRRHRVEFAGSQREWFSMPYQDRQAGVERYIWGATAGMLRNLYRFLIA